MNKIKSTAGYIWVAVSFCILSGLTVLSGMAYDKSLPVEKLNAFFGLKLSGGVNGGPVSFVFEKGTGEEKYRINVHEPVFEGIGNGFVQVTWEPVKGTLPAILNDDIDYNRDGVKDFSIKFDTRNVNATIEKYNPKVIGFDCMGYGVFDYKATRGIRVVIEK